MAKKANNPFYFASASLIAVGCAFAAIGGSGQEAFGWTSIGLLVPGLALLVAGLMNRRRAS